MSLFSHSQMPGFRWNAPWASGLCLVRHAALCLMAGCALQAATTVFHLDNASGRSWQLADPPKGTGCMLDIQATGPGQWEAAPSGSEYRGRVLPGASLRLTMACEPGDPGLQLALTAPPASPLLLTLISEPPCSNPSDILLHTIEARDTLSFRRISGVPGQGPSSSSSSSSSSSPVAVPAPAQVVFLRNGSRQPWTLTYPKTGVSLLIASGEAVMLHPEQSNERGGTGLAFYRLSGPDHPASRGGAQCHAGGTGHLRGPVPV